MGVERVFGTGAADAERAARLRAGSRRFSFVGGAFAVVLACVALVGWVTRTPVLARPFGGSQTMKANTALCIVALGVVIAGAAVRPSWSRAGWWRGLCLGASVVAGLTLVEYVSGRSLGIDELLFTDSGTAYRAPGRMAAVTAACLLLLGVGLLAGTLRVWGHRVRSVAAAAVACISGVSALGYLFGASELYQPFGTAAIAVQTAVVLVLLSVAVYALDPADSFVELCVSQGPGGILVRRVIPGATVAILVVGWVRLQGQEAGWYGTAFGVAIMTITCLVVLWVLVIPTAKRLERVGHERRSAEHAAATATSDLEAILDAAPVAIYVKDVDGRYRVANRWFCERFVPPGQQVTGRRDVDLYPPDVAAERVARDAEVVSSGRAIESTDTVQHDDGPCTYLAARFPLLGTNGVRAVCGIFTDITERTRSDQRERDLQARLESSERLESMGRLASGIAHDFNNLLSVILVAAELLAEAVPPQSQEREDAGLIADTARRAAALTQQLLIYARRSIGNRTAIDCNAFVREIGGLLARTIGEDLRLELAPSAEPAFVMGDQVQLESVIMNLAVNARDAMPSGGELTISCGVTAVDAELLAGDGSGPGRYVRIAVADTGVGMARDVLLHAFEPFFTTKNDGTGTGLGLATVYGAVAGAGGFVRVDSEVGSGTTVRCYFPLSGDVAKAPVRGSGPETNRYADATVLVVEDADDLRASVVRLLTHAGYQAHAVSGIDEAFEYVRTRVGRVDLVLTDVIMPGGSGPELARRLAGIRPALPVAFMSGYAGDALEQHDFDPSQHIIIEKPFTRESLIGAVTTILDAHTVDTTP